MLAIAAAIVTALKWPATAATLAGLVLLFPDGGRHVAAGLVLIFGAGLGQLAWSFRRRRRLRVDPTVVATGLLFATTALALVATLGSAAAGDAVRSSFRWIGLATGLLMLPIQLFLIGNGATRPAVILGGGVLAGLALALADQAVPSILAHTPLGHLLSTVQSDRATGIFDSPNRLGTVAGMALIVSLVALWTTLGRKQRFLMLGVAGVAAAALLLSFSRAAMLGVGVAVALLLVLRSRRLGLAVGAALLVLGLIVGPFIISARLGFDAGARSGQLAADDAERVAAWRAGISMFMSEPLTGQGYGSFAWKAPDLAGPADLQTAHNELIALLAETGIPGAAAFVAIFASVVVRSRSPGPGSRIALGTTTVFLVATMFNVQSAYPQVTVVLFTCVAYGLRAGRADGRVGSGDRATAQPAVADRAEVKEPPGARSSVVRPLASGWGSC